MYPFFGKPCTRPNIGSTAQNSFFIFSEYIQKGERSLSKTSSKEPIKTLPFIGKQVFVLSYGTKYQSIVHLSGKKHGTYGSWTPGVWLYRDRLYVGTALNGNWNHGYNSNIKLPLKKWVEIKIAQKFSRNKVRKFLA